MNREQRRALNKRKMYQCHVMATADDGREYQHPVGPRMDHQDGPMSLCESINKAVALGKEKRWHDARVLQVER
jgi:hypothetical protein